MKLLKNHFLSALVLVLVAAALRFILVSYSDAEFGLGVRLVTILVIFSLGAAYVLQGAANIVEETTNILSKRTKLAGGFLQSFGTAFPDMALGVAAAFISLRFSTSDPAKAIHFAVIAAATTFGSNIFNIAHAVWCVFRQNTANALGKALSMFPFTKRGGMVTPMRDHAVKPSLKEIDVAMDIANLLTVLTAGVALSMVLFGKVTSPHASIDGDLYRLIKPVSLVIFVAAAFILYSSRKTHRPESPIEEIAAEEQYFEKKSNIVIWLYLFLAGAAILLAADSMVRALESFSEITGLPYIIAGVFSGIIGCLGEIMVVHSYTVNPKGRIGDAIVGVALDNVVTILGASLVGLIGGIFLGGNALIMIFVIIFVLNSALMWQMSKLKNFFLR